MPLLTGSALRIALSLLVTTLSKTLLFSRFYMDRVKRIWYLSHMRAAKVQASLLIRAVSPEPLLLAHTSSESRGTFRQKARSLAPLNGWACAVEICHDGMLEDTNSLDGAHISATALSAVQWRMGYFLDLKLIILASCAKFKWYLDLSEMLLLQFFRFFL